MNDRLSLELGSDGVEERCSPAVGKSLLKICMGGLDLDIVDLKGLVMVDLANRIALHPGESRDKASTLMLSFLASTTARDCHVRLQY